MILLYQLGIRLFYFGIIISSLFNRKAKLFIRGRREVYKRLISLRSFPHSEEKPERQLAWFHCSSLGEFEQATPLIERIKNKNYKVLVTFFSPSGYEARKNFDGADAVCYLPIDTKSNVKRFLNAVNPSHVFFIKYDFWYNYLHELHRRNIPTCLVSANFRQEQFRGWYGKYLKTILIFFNRICVQNESSKNTLDEQGIIHVSVSGDLRYDKVSQTAMDPKKIPVIEHFKGSGKLIVCGSTWEKDEEIISQKSKVKSQKLIIAPHEINEARIRSVIQRFSDMKVVRFSEISKESVTMALDKLRDAEILIIDNIGMLSHLYQYAGIAYIGGGFNQGIHNILEAVAFGAPVIFGPKHHKFPEAAELIKQGGGFSIADSQDYAKAINLLTSDEKILQMASMVCKNFISQRRGAVERILAEVKFD